MAKMKLVDKIATGLVLVGALNWGLVGFFDFNLVTSILPSASKIVYDVIGLSAVLFTWKLFR